MRRLLNTLYVNTPDAYLSLDGENVVVNSNGQELKRVPMHNLENIVTFGWQGASPALMHHACELGIGIAFFTNSGRFLCRVEGEKRGNVLLRREQYRIADNENRSLAIVRNMIGAKTVNSRTVLMRALRDHPLLPESDKISVVADKLKNSLADIQKADDKNTIRGIEGSNASMYFSVFNSLILQNKETFSFNTRSRHPPTDNVNALLSFCYSITANECASALEAVGLDPYVGFLHTDRPGRKSLALDLMEEIRSIYCDRFVISLINLRQINGDGFYIKENGAVIMTDETRKVVLTSWHKRRQEEIIHPFLGEKCELGLLPFIQAQLLARYIRGDIDDYPPYIWK